MLFNFVIIKLFGKKYFLHQPFRRAEWKPNCGAGIDIMLKPQICGPHDALTFAFSVLEQLLCNISTSTVGTVGLH